MQKQLTDLIVQKLRENANELKQQFNHQHQIKVARHLVIDNLLPTDLAMEIYASFPSVKQMRWLKSAGELKLKYNHIKHTAPLLQDMHFAIQDPRVIACIEEITQIKRQLPDTSSHAGGISAMLKGGYINPHIDNSHDAKKKLYRTVNVLYYTTPNWKLENGGNYELWDVNVNNRIIVPSLFNRMVVMETNPTSWHAVNAVCCDEPRRCLFNYYFSEYSPIDIDYYHGASLFFNPCFKPRPEQKIRRKIAMVRNKILRFIRAC